MNVDNTFTFVQRIRRQTIVRTITPQDSLTRFVVKVFSIVLFKYIVQEIVHIRSIPLFFRGCVDDFKS